MGACLSTAIDFEPLGTLGLSADSLDDSGYRKKRRKHWLAEFELAEAPVLRAGRTEVSKADVLAAFELLEDPDARRYLLRVSGTGPARVLLTDGELPQNKESCERLAASLSALAKLSGHETFERLWTKRLRAVVDLHWKQRRDGLAISPVAEAVDRDSPALRGPVFAPIREEIEAAVAQIREDREGWDRGKKPSLKGHLSQSAMYRAVGALPQSFSPEKTKLATALRALSVAVHNGDIDDPAIPRALIDLATVAASGTSSQSHIQKEAVELRKAQDNRPTPQVDAALKLLLELAKSELTDSGKSLPRSTPYRERVQQLINSGQAMVVFVNNVGNGKDDKDFRDRVAGLLRMISVACWNCGGLKDLARPVLDLASSVNAGVATRELIKADTALLASQPVTTGNGCAEIFWVVGIIGIILFALSHCK